MSINPCDSRLLALENWLKNDLKLNVHSIAPASSDASFRRYFRVQHSNGPHVVMDAPPDKENVSAFVSLDKFFEEYGMHVPHIFAENLSEGFLLLEDFGNTSLLQSLNNETVDDLYTKAMQQLFFLQNRVDPDLCQTNSYDQALLNRELDIFTEWFVQGLLGIELPESIKSSLYESLINSALEQPKVCVHRDFHSRNLMLLEDQSLGIIDFQDAVIGPITYDLVSLLRDCYVSWPDQRVERWMNDHYQVLINAKKLNVPYHQFKRWFDWMGMQRHLKAIGIFARLHLRDQKSGYLQDIPRTLNYVLAVSTGYPDFVEFHSFLETQIVPIYQEYL